MGSRRGRAAPRRAATAETAGLGTQRLSAEGLLGAKRGESTTGVWQGQGAACSAGQVHCPGHRRGSTWPPETGFLLEEMKE